MNSDPDRVCKDGERQVFKTLKHWDKSPAAFINCQKLHPEAAKCLQPVGWLWEFVSDVTPASAIEFAEACTDDFISRYENYKDEREELVDHLAYAWLDKLDSASFRLYQSRFPEFVHLLKEKETVATAQEEIYSTAAERQVLVTELSTSGRRWNATFCDFKNPKRPEGKVFNQDRESLIDFIVGWAERGREEWEERNSNGHVGGFTVEATEMPSVIELPADDTQAYEDGYNAGLSEGIALGSQNVTNEESWNRKEVELEAYERGLKVGSAGGPTEEDIEQLRREAKLEAYNEIKANFDKELETAVNNARNEGIEEGALAERAANGSSEAIITEILDKFAESQARGNLKWSNLIEALGSFQTAINAFSPTGDATSYDTEYKRIHEGLAQMIADRRKAKAK